VTNSVTIHSSGVVTVEVAEVSCGLDLAENATLDVDGVLAIDFTAPAATRPHYGLAWAGKHVTALEGMISAGKLTIDTAGLDGVTVGVYSIGRTTYVGVPPPAGVMLIVR